MTESLAKHIESVLPFLPPEPGLRAHVRRVAALAGRTITAHHGTPEEKETAEIAALLHHYQPDAETSGMAKLLSDLGMGVPAQMQPLPARALEAWSTGHEPGDLCTLIESANLFDEHFENLPYDDLRTADSVRELMNSGVVCEEFAIAIQSFRVVSGSRLFEAARALPVDLATRRWFPAKSYESIYAHSMEVAQAASVFARETNVVSEADAYLAGVFHDIGRVPYQSAGVRKHLQEWENLDFPPLYAEFLVSGTDHTAIGAELLRTWEFPNLIVDAVDFHHRLELNPSRLAAVVYAAEDPFENLPSCGRDHISAQRISISELRYNKAAGSGS